MRLRKIKSFEELDGKYCAIIDAIDFCDVYVGKYNSQHRELNDAICSPTRRYTLGADQNGISRGSGFSFSKSFIDEHINNFFLIDKIDYQKIIKIKTASSLRKIKRYII